MIPYTLIRSKRRTLSLGISRDGELIARAPRLMSISFIEAFIMKKLSWIDKHQAQVIMRRSSGKRKEYDASDIQVMKKLLREYLEVRVRDVWKDKKLPLYTSLKVTKSEKRWGSCSGKNGLCFSYRLAEYLPGISLSPSKCESLSDISEIDVPTESEKYNNLLFIDAIIYHELAHLKEKNHGKKFWLLVYSMMPDYERVMKDMKHLD